MDKITLLRARVGLYRHGIRRRRSPLVRRGTLLLHPLRRGPDDDIPGDINPDPDDDGGYWCRFLDEPCWGECHMGYARCPHEPDEPQDNELSEEEVGALLLLLKLGMDFYTGNPAGDALGALRSVPNRVIDGVIAKAGRAGTAALKGGGNGRTVSC